MKTTLWHEFFVHINKANCLKLLEKESGHDGHLQEVTRWLQDRLKAETKLKGFMILLKAELYRDVYLMKQKTLSLKHILKDNKSCARSFQSYMVCLVTNHSCSKKKPKQKNIVKS